MSGNDVVALVFTPSPIGTKRRVITPGSCADEPVDRLTSDALLVRVFSLSLMVD